MSEKCIKGESCLYCGSVYCQFVDEINKLKAENEKLKADKKQLLKDCNSCNFHKYKQALEDIREIVNEPCIEDEDCETCDTNCMCKEILYIINEVLND